jgi:hypothetical protein
MKKNIFKISAAWALLILVLCVLPVCYRAFANRLFTSQCDDQFGRTGWAIIGKVADHQFGEELDLYRTLYVRLVYPACQRVTPWKELTFTHKTSCIVRPWHYSINVVTVDREITYYWSMRASRWEKVWDNAIKDYWPEKRKGYAEQLAHVERREGMNYARK